MCWYHSHLKHTNHYLESSRLGKIICNGQYSEHVRHLSVKNKTTVVGCVCDIIAICYIIAIFVMSLQCLKLILDNTNVLYVLIIISESSCFIKVNAYVVV